MKKLIKKLKLVDIAIHASYNGLVLDKSTKAITKICDISFSKSIVTLKSSDNVVYPNRIFNDIKLVKRSMSNLLKPIRVEGYKEGKEFIPVLELANLGFRCTNNYTHAEPYILEDGYIMFRQFLLWTDDTRKIKSPGALFDLSPSHFEVKNASLLDQWHFDWQHNLIEDGLAIDMNTLELIN